MLGLTYSLSDPITVPATGGLLLRKPASETHFCAPHYLLNSYDGMCHQLAGYTVAGPISTPITAEPIPMYAVTGLETWCQYNDSWFARALDEAYECSGSWVGRFLQ
ncbi:MAG: hypothetical protein ABH859_01565 [Pseudomonadota bacterium]